MSTQTSYFKLGIFVLAATALLCAGVIVLGAGKLLERTLVVETYMTSSVDGLSKGSAVKYQGLEVGQVAGISFAARKYDPDMMSQEHLRSPILVELALWRKRLPDGTEDELASWLELAVRAGFRARLASSGLTGPTFVEFAYLDPESYPPPTIGWTPPRFYVPAAPSTAQVLIGAVHDILDKLRRLDLEDTVDDLDTLLENANDKVQALDVQTLNDEAVSLLKELRGSNRRLREILDNPNVDPSLENLRATLENAKNATARIRDILDDPQVEAMISNVSGASGELSPALGDLRRAVRRIDRLIASQEASLASAIDELNQAMTNIRALTEDAKENPSRILFGDPPPRSRIGSE